MYVWGYSTRRMVLYCRMSARKHHVLLRSFVLRMYYTLDTTWRVELELELENCLFDKKKIQTWHNITQSTWQYVFFFVGRPLQRRWAHRLRKGHPRVLQCVHRHCTMKGQTFGSVGKLNTHTSWDRAPSRLMRGTQLTITMRGKETKTSVLNTTS